MINIRQKDIAEKTGLSINTVSLALKDSPRVKKETRDLVQKIAQEMDYIPNSLARGLVKQDSKTIGVILKEFQTPILVQVTREIENILNKKGYAMILMTTGGNAERENEAIDILLSRQVNGILIFPVEFGDYKKIEQLYRRNFPVVLMSYGGTKPPADAVYVDRKLGAYRAVEHLIRLGHEKIAFIHGHNDVGINKMQGYCDALKDYDVELNSKYLELTGGVSYQEGYNAIEKVFSKVTPTAVFCSTDYHALGVLSWCQKHGVRVPQDLAVVGHDDTEPAAFAQVPLTCMSYLIEQETKLATDALFKLMEQKEKQEIQNTPIEPKLTIRESCGYNLKGGYVRNQIEK